MRRVVAVLVAIALFATACSGNEKRPAAVPVYVAVGASETVGVGADHPATEAWPTVFARTALPKGSRYVNVGISGATVQEALAKELPRALKERPTVVTVWLNVNDMLAFVTRDRYQGQLQDLVHQLRQGGRARVLVANVPPLDRLPAYTSRFGALVPASVVDTAVDGYDAAIAAVVAAEGAELVDLHAAGLAERAAGTEGRDISGDGFHPSTAGHAVVAARFAAVYRSHP